MDDLRGRVVLVTGSTRDTGLAAARTLTAAGAAVVLTGRDASTAAEVAVRMRAELPGDDAVAAAVAFALGSPTRALPSRIELRPAHGRPTGGG